MTPGSRTSDRKISPADEQFPGGVARDAIDPARERIRQISEDIRDMVAAHLDRALYLGTLVLETGRILDELATGLDAAFVTAPLPGGD